VCGGGGSSISISSKKKKKRTEKEEGNLTGPKRKEKHFVILVEFLTHGNLFLSLQQLLQRGWQLILFLTLNRENLLFCFI
jgi:hypothetical protein